MADKNVDIIGIVNPRECESVEEALGISDARHKHLGFIFDDVFEKSPTLAEALLAISNTPGLSSTETTYLGYKLFDRIARHRIPFWGLISKGIV